MSAGFGSGGDIVTSVSGRREQREIRTTTDGTTGRGWLGLLLVSERNENSGLLQRSVGYRKRCWIRRRQRGEREVERVGCGIL